MIGLVHSYLPYMILTCYISLAGDRRFADRGGALPRRAAGRRSSGRVVLPLAMPGIVAGSILIFVPVDRLLHGAAHPRRPQRHMLGTVIEDQFTAVFNWPLGAALSFILLAIVLLILAAALSPLLREGCSWHEPRSAGSGACYLGCVLAFLYLPIVVMVVMAFNASPLYQLPFAVDDWSGSRRLPSNDQAARRHLEQRRHRRRHHPDRDGARHRGGAGLRRLSSSARQTLLQLLLFPPIAIPG